MKQLELSELTAYAENRYHIREERQWKEHSNFSVLVHPMTGKWIAILMREWNSITGEYLERCDIKCGRQALSVATPYLREPFRMKSPYWLGVEIGRVTTPTTVFELLDQAMQAENNRATEIVIPPRSNGGYRDTPLAARVASHTPSAAPATNFLHDIPKRLLELRRMLVYAHETYEQKRLNFYKQAKFMADYEDNFAWHGEINQYFPTYSSLTLQQLRGYFTWRTQIRQGIYQKTATAFAYIYIYELLCGAGATTPEEVLQKLEVFEKNYILAVLGDTYMRANLHRWMLGYAVMHDFPAHVARRYADSAITQLDDALLALKTPDAHADEDIVEALVRFSDGKIADSPIMLGDDAPGTRLFAAVWRTASLGYMENGEDLFTACFRAPKYYPWGPLTNAIYWEDARHANTEYMLNECRSFRCRNGIWEELRYDALYFNKKKLSGLLHEADRALRKYLKTGHYLRKKPDEEWATPFVEAVIEAEERAKAEAARPKITLDLSGLDRIRKDADVTRDSLLTDSEIDAESQATAQPQDADAPQTSQPEASEMPSPQDAHESINASAPSTSSLGASDAPDAFGGRLDDIHRQILTALLNGEDARALIRANHLMTSIVADTINEAFFDEIGDNILECDGDTLTLVEDYREDVAALA